MLGVGGKCGGIEGACKLEKVSVLLYLLPFRGYSLKLFAF